MNISCFQKTFVFFRTMLSILLIAGLSVACSTASTQPPSFTVITIPLGIDPNGSYQMLPYSLETGGGHYLLYGVEAKKLIYDGKEIYSGDLAGYGREGIALSQNGLHYAYVLPSTQGGNFRDLFIDSVKVTTAEYLANPAVTDDGEHYFYTGCLDKEIPGSCLVKDGNNIYTHPDGILDFWISQSGDAYLASLRNFDSNNNFVESLVLNGNQIHEGTELSHKLFSLNGKHYAYVSLDQNNLQHLIVDGTDQRTSEALILLQVTDQGSVCTWDSGKGQVVINTEEIPVTHEQIQCYLTEDASHTLINDGSWSLDGQPIQFTSVEPNDKTLGEMGAQGWYVYRLVK